MLYDYIVNDGDITFIVAETKRLSVINQQDGQGYGNDQSSLVEQV